MKSIILAGGSGTRLWPLSRKAYPKQFLKLNGDKSLLSQTMERLLEVSTKNDIIVMTNEDYKFHVQSDMNSLYHEGSSAVDDNIILEPMGRNTAPAIALGIVYCQDKLGCRDNEVIFISPSDHVIKPAETFGEYVKGAERIANDGHIVTFGIKPVRAETGYGYIKCRDLENRKGKSIYFDIEQFTEKPDQEMASRYIQEGNYYWNSGMFAFRIDSMLEEFERYAPDISKLIKTGYDTMVSRFDELPDISIDYAIMERSDKVVMIPLELFWNDIGSWDSISDISDKDGEGNVTRGDVITEDTRNSLILGSKRLIATIGMEDCLVVETDDAVLIAKKGEAQKVKDLVSRLKADGRHEAEEHVTTYRPWGSYTVLEEGERYKIKRIAVKPLAKLSLQKHKHRSEHWVVVSGKARTTIGDNEVTVHENESVFVPKSTLHRLENPEETVLEIIEVQNGEYVGEDDIERFDDVYGRSGS
jgi:mannose-1-phosphate guanylyltransferase/mannose-6-phosphate isomerase